MSFQFRDRFHVPRAADGRECVYFCGHSLGLQPKTTRAYIEQEMSDWERLGVDGHFRAAHPWVQYGKLLTDQTARLVGAKPIEVVTMNSLTVNLHLMMVSFYRPTPARHRIVMEEHAFPSDRWAVKSQLRFHGYDPAEAVRIVSGEDELEDLLHREGDSVALVLMAGINYSSGRAFDMGRIARAAHAHGAAAGFDLAHAAGNIPLHLHDWDADFAVWCTYKYLNGGPGSVAGCFVHERHAHDENLPRFAGWWGHEFETRFRMGPDFHPSPGAEGWQVSNPSVLDMAALRARSLELTGYLESRLEQFSGRGFSILTPRDPARRGAQLSIRVPGSVRSLWERLAAAGVVCDWREPDILRVAPAPMYNTTEDIDRFIDRFAKVSEPKA